MAFLIPLFAPTIIETTTNIALGISNSIQGDSSSISLQLGKKVFSTHRGFPLTQLPYELREEILLMALEESRSLILPPPVLLNPYVRPTATELAAIQSRSPLNPNNPNYLSLNGEIIHANGYPITSWRWLRLCREWWAILRPRLWRDLNVSGYSPYANLLGLLEDGDFHGLPFVRTLTLLDGFQSTSDLYTIIRAPALKKLSSLSILPTYPHSSNPFVQASRAFPFGLQLIPTFNSSSTSDTTTTSPLKILNLGLPLDVCTNAASRQHLRELKLSQLGISLRHPTTALFSELETLLLPPIDTESSSDNAQAAQDLSTSSYLATAPNAPSAAESFQTLSIRLVPTYTSPLPSPSIFLALPLRRFPRISIYLPRTTTLGRLPYEDQSSAEVPFSQRLVDLVAPDDEMRDKVEIYLVGGLGGDNWVGAASDGGAKKDGTERIWPYVTDDEKAELEAAGEREKEEEGRRKMSREAEKKTKETWERQTYLSLGPLGGLRMESKKT